MKQMLKPLWRDIAEIDLIGWTVLLCLFGLLGAFLTFLLQDGLNTAYWLNGFIAGAISAVGQIIIYKLARVDGFFVSCAFTLTLFIVVTIGAQTVYIEDSKKRLQIELEDAGSDWPVAWQSLSSDEAYDAQIKYVLKNEQADGWFDHLRTQAKLGLASWEREVQYQWVYRKNYDAWLGWMFVHGWFFFGNSLGVCGAIFQLRSAKKIRPEIKTSKIDTILTQIPDKVDAIEPSPQVISGWTTDDGLYNIYLTHDPQQHTVIGQMDLVKGGHSSHTSNSFRINIDEILELGFNQWLDQLGAPETAVRQLEEWWKNLGADTNSD